MYLSHLIMDPRSRQVIMDIGDSYQLHRTILSGFPENLDSGERVLYRMEIRSKVPCLTVLVQSRTLPNWSRLENDGYLLQPAKTKNYQPAVSGNQVYRFRLNANPTKRLKGVGEKDGSRVGLTKEDDQIKWIQRKGSDHGFSILKVQTTRVMQPDGWKNRKEGNQPIHTVVVQFDGILRVEDAGKFLASLENGIGSGKGFGCGLLSIARA